MEPWRGPFLSLMNNLFHGMDFSGMVVQRPFAWQGSLQRCSSLSTWALGLWDLAVAVVVSTRLSAVTSAATLEQQQ